MKKKNLTTLILILLFFTGLSLILYPSFSDYWNSLHSTRAIAGYDADLAKLNEEDYSAFWEAAERFNLGVPIRENPYLLSPEEKEEYPALLDLSGNGMMGMVDIPCIQVTLPIYHGTSESVLQVGVGHLDWTSLPTGGEGNQCVMSGHTGLPSARLLTDLSKLVPGDLFDLQILDRTLSYEVDQILVVLPTETSALLPVEGEDYCTLVTCTPYGVNTHRLLVRGRRIFPAEKKTVRVTADAARVDVLIVAPLTAVPLLILLLTATLIRDAVRRRRRRFARLAEAESDAARMRAESERRP